MTVVLALLVAVAWACALQVPARLVLLRWLLFGVFTFMGLALGVVGWIASAWDPATRPSPAAHPFMVSGAWMLGASIWTLLRAAIRDRGGKP